MIFQALAPMVGSSWFQMFLGWFHDPEGLLLVMGPWVLWGTLGIVLIESGVLFPVLPGDSLLFTAGLLHDRLGLRLPTLVALTFVAAFIGAQIGYWIGACSGRRLFSPDARLLKTEYLDKAERYSADYGGRALVIGRFIPPVRTFIPLAAGITRYFYPRLPVFNSLGALLWGSGITYLGSVSGGAAFVHGHLPFIILAIVGVSLLSMIIKLIVHRGSKDSKAQDSGAEGLNVQDLNPEDETAGEDNSDAMRVGEAVSCSEVSSQAAPFDADAVDAASEGISTTSENLSEQSMLGQRWMLTPTIIEMLIAAVPPAVFRVRARARSPLIPLAVVPVIIFFFIIVLSTLSDWVGISWQREHVPPVLGIFTFISVLVPAFTKVRELIGRRVTRDVILHVLEERRLGGAESSGAETSGPEKVRAARDRVEPGQVEVTGAEASGFEEDQVSQGRVTQVGGEKGRFRQGRVEPELVDGLIWAMVATGSFLAALPTPLHANPELLAQQWDSTFHSNGVRSILQFGLASLFGGLSDFYGGRNVFYLTTWHAFAVFFPTFLTVIRVANASSIVLMIIWALGASTLTSVVTRRRGTIPTVPILSGPLLDMPADNLTMYNQWPNVMGLAAVPGIAALAVIPSRRIAGAFKEGIRPLLRELYLSIFLLLGAAGISATHPGSAFVSAALFIPAPLAGPVIVLRRAVASGSWLRAILATLIVASATLMLFLALTMSKIRAMGEYSRPGSTWPYALSYTFTPIPPFTETTSMSMMVLLQAGLILLGTAYLSGLMIPKSQETGGGIPSSSSIIKESEQGHEKSSDSKPLLSGGQWDDNELGSHDDLWDDKATPPTREHPDE